METSGRDYAAIFSSDLLRCEELVLRFRLEGYRSTFFVDDAALLKSWDRMRPQLLVLDASMGGILRKLPNPKPPVVAIAERGEIRAAVDVMKLGAADVLFDPLDPDELLLVARDAIRGSPRVLTEVNITADLGKLTNREKEVLQLIAEGQSNKEAGRELGISPRTIEVHRARVMSKLGAKNTADLMRIVLS